jgi:hypothetical protein
MGNIMLYRSLPVVLVLLAVACFVGSAALADNKDKDAIHDGKVVKAGNGTLTMTDLEGKAQHTHKVAANAMISLDGKECKLEDLKPGFRVKVTPGTEGDKAVTKIEASSK